MPNLLLSVNPLSQSALVDTPTAPEPLPGEITDPAMRSDNAHSTLIPSEAAAADFHVQASTIGEIQTMVEGLEAEVSMLKSDVVNLAAAIAECFRILLNRLEPTNRGITAEVNIDG